MFLLEPELFEGARYKRLLEKTFQAEGQHMHRPWGKTELGILGTKGGTEKGQEGCSIANTGGMIGLKVERHNGTFSE